jgi:glycine/D-amino acid oxidase-like deaminating enzyme
MSAGTPGGSERPLTRRAFLRGAAVGGAGVLGAAVLPRACLSRDPERPPSLYEFYVDSFWMDAAGLWSEPVRPPLRGRQRADVAIVGGGFAGMATAYHLAKRLPGRRIVLLEGARCGYGASGRNGGFATPGRPGLEWIWEHGGPEAARAFYDATLLGLAQIRAFGTEHGVDCDLEETGSLRVATDERQLEHMAEGARRIEELGLRAEVLDAAALRRGLHSERFVGGVRMPGAAILNPAKLALGMRRAIESLGVVVSERSKVLRFEPGATVRLTTEYAEVEAPQAVLAMNGYAPQIGVLERRVLPLCNYVVATEPLTPAQWASIGWSGREGMSDARTLFMYLRPTADGRIVAGGESAPYFYGSSPSSGVYRPSIEKLKTSLVASFPQLEGVRFTHEWGGTMGFTRDLTPSLGRLDGAENVFYAACCNGEGVVMTQLAGMILARLVAGDADPLTALAFVDRPLPWLGPEPLRSIAVRASERVLEALGVSPMG